MTDEIERRWDDAMEEAWTGFRGRVADRLAELGEDDTLLVDLATPAHEDGETVTPYCLVTAYSRSVRIEAVSTPFFPLSEPQEQALLGLGFRPPSDRGSPLFWRDVGQREVDRAAWMIVQAMRDVYGVLHPIYLDAEGLEPSPGEVEVVEAPALDESPRFPNSPEELMEVLREVVSDLLGHEASLDEDGDLPIQTDKAVLYLTVSPKAPRLLVHASLVSEVVDVGRAVVEVNLLNRAEFGLTFVLFEGTISLRRELPMTAVVPRDVQTELSRICGDVDRWVSELVARVGGRGLLEEVEAHPPGDRRRNGRSREPEDERFVQALRVLRELEGEERGSVDIATLTRIFHADRDLLLAASRWAVSRAAHWNDRRRKADAEGKAAYAKLCRAQARYHQEMRGRVRKALRSVVQTPVKPERQAQLSLFSEDEASA